jgi:hypothetical protein
MLNHLRLRPAYLIVAATVSLSLTGCVTVNEVAGTKTSSSPVVTSAVTQVPTAKVLFETMRKNVAAAKSVRLKGEVTQGGQELKIDITGDRNGKNLRALVNDGAFEVEFLTAGGNVYMKANAAYWTKNASATVAKVAAGKYVKAPTALPGMDKFKVGYLLDGIHENSLPSAGILPKVERTDVDGVPAYMLTERVSGEVAKVYISADGKARLMRILSASNAGALDFSEWDAVGPMSPPSADQLVKIPGVG